MRKKHNYGSPYSFPVIMSINLALWQLQPQRKKQHLWPRAKMFLTSSSFETVVHQPFKWVVMLLDWHKLSIQKNCLPLKQHKLSLKKIISCFNNTSFLLKRIVSHSNGSSYIHLKNCQPFKQLSILRLPHYELFKYALFINTLWIVVVLFLNLSFLHFHTIQLKARGLCFSLPSCSFTFLFWMHSHYSLMKSCAVRMCNAKLRNDFKIKRSQ